MQVGVENHRKLLALKEEERQHALTQVRALLASSCGAPNKLVALPASPAAWVDHLESLCRLHLQSSSQAAC